VYLHLHTGEPAPPEYIRLVLCRDIYHCTPTELRTVPLRDVLETLATLGAETAYHNRPKSKPTSSA
jgi:hypothetical protein